MMERLTHYQKDGEVAEPYNRSQAYEFAKKLAEYEDLEEQGLLVRLPRNVGDTVWTIRGYNCCDGKCCWFNDGKCKRPNDNYCPKQIIATTYNYSMIGKTVFLTREEAEAALTKIEQSK